MEKATSVTADDKALVAQAYDRIADAYLEKFGCSVVRLRKLDELCAGLAPAARILDLGCGAGLPVAQMLVARGFAVTGIDGSAAQIERARSNVPMAHFIHVDMTEAELPRGAFDAVAAFYSITHVPRGEHCGLLENIAGWLKPGGCLLASFGVTSFDGRQAGWLGETMFFSHHGADATRELIVDAGFRLDRTEIIQQDDEDAAFLWITATRLPPRPGGAGPTGSRGS